MKTNNQQNKNYEDLSMGNRKGTRNNPEEAQLHRDMTGFVDTHSADIPLKELSLNIKHQNIKLNKKEFLKVGYEFDKGEIVIGLFIPIPKEYRKTRGKTKRYSINYDKIRKGVSNKDL